MREHWTNIDSKKNKRYYIHTYIHIMHVYMFKNVKSNIYFKRVINLFMCSLFRKYWYMHPYIYDMVVLFYKHLSKSLIIINTIGKYDFWMIFHDRLSKPSTWVLTYSIGIFTYQNHYSFIKISQKLPMDLTETKPSLVQVMAWRRAGDKPWTESMLAQFTAAYMHPKPQWVNQML